MPSSRFAALCRLCVALVWVGACQPAPLTQVEIYSSWVTGPEAVGLQQLSEQFQALEPGAVITNAARQAGTDPEAALRVRMVHGDPPDSFQVHMGQAFIATWVKQGYMQPLDDVYAKYGLNDLLPAGVEAMVSFDGHPYSVPVNIHRVNVLWYNRKLLESAGISPSMLTTFVGWKEAAEKLNAAGITPLALGDTDVSADTNLFETVLMGTLGGKQYVGLFDGTTDWEGADVQHALENFKMMVSYSNDDHSTLTWDQANQLVIEGKSAFTIMADWADADYVAKNFRGYGWALPPGNNGIYDAMADSFGLPKGSKQPQLMKEFLGVLGSKRGQETLAKSDGAICARTDCDYSGFDAYLQSSAVAWGDAAIVPSIAYGAAVSEEWSAAIDNAVSALVTTGDVQDAQVALARACRDAGACK